MTREPRPHVSGCDARHAPGAPCRVYRPKRIQNRGHRRRGAALEAAPLCLLFLAVVVLWSIDQREAWDPVTWYFERASANARWGVFFLALGLYVIPLGRLYVQEWGMAVATVLIKFALLVLAFGAGLFALVTALGCLGGCRPGAETVFWIVYVVMLVLLVSPTVVTVVSAVTLLRPPRSTILD